MSIFIDDEDRKRFSDYILSEVKLAEAERSGKLEDYKRYRRQRMAVPDRKMRNWPWPKASNICTPLALINTNGTFGSLKATFGTKSPKATLKTNIVALEKATTAFNGLFNQYLMSPKKVNISEVDNTVLYDLGSLGTQFVRVAWDKDVFNLKRRTENDEIINKEIVRKNSPVIVPYRIEDVFVRSHVTNIHTAPWIATVAYLHEHELRQREAKGIFSNVDKVLTSYGTLLNEAKESELQNMGFSPTEDDTFQILEVNAFWDVDGDGVFEDVKVWLEKCTGEVLREEFNELGKRDIVRLPYIHIPYSVFALGVGAIVDHMQQEADTLHNLRINQQIMALAPQIVVKEGTQLKGDTVVRPGGKFVVQNMDDIKEFRTMDFSSLAIQSEMIVREYAGQATSINNSMLGLPDVYAKTRGTASGYMFQAQQSVRQFTSSVIENIRTGYEEIYSLIALQMLIHKDELDFASVEPEDAALIQQIFAINPEDFASTFSIEVKVTEQTETDEAKKQARIMLIQFYTNYGEKLIQLSTVMENPQVPTNTKALAARLMVGATKILDEILEDFGKKDERELLPYLEDINFRLNQMDFMKQAAVAQATMMMQGRMGGEETPPGGSSNPNPPPAGMI